MSFREVAPIVADASAFGEYLLRTDVGLQVQTIIEAPDASLNVPSLCDVEIVSILRRLVRATRIDVDRATRMLDVYVRLPTFRHDHRVLITRIFALRENFAASDATYVALAERLGATLVTCDLRLTRATRQFADVNVVGVGA